MAAIKTTRSDVVWNYAGTAMSFANGLVLLPLLVHYLAGNELGLWYVFLAISNLVALFEFGFHPALSRNMVYVMSGARRLTSEGCDYSSAEVGVDWHLLNVVICVTKVVYGILAVVALLVLATLGTFYVSAIASGGIVGEYYVSWVLFCIAMVFNLYFLYSFTMLRGVGDIAGENQAKCIGSACKLIVSAALLVMGFGLLGASVGYLVNAILVRLFAMARFGKHREVVLGRVSDEKRVRLHEIKTVLLTVGNIAWRDGIVKVALYATTQATTLLCSVFLSLEETGSYAILAQIGGAIVSLSAAYNGSFYPEMQSAFAINDIGRQRKIAATGIVAYWLLIFLGVFSAITVMPFLFRIIKPGILFDPVLFTCVAFYMALVQQHSMFCNYIIGRNEIPYMRAYVISAIVGIVCVSCLCGIAGLGVWGLVLGQAFVQLAYNNWKWPSYYCKSIETSYLSLLREGAGIWRGRVIGYFGKVKQRSR